MSRSALSPRLVESPTTGDLEIAAARMIVTAIAAAMRQRERCLMALSGGHTPRGVYHLLADLLVAQSIDLSRLHIIFVDERMVRPTDPESNYGMVQRELTGRIPIPPAQVHRIKGERQADVAAQDYEQELMTVLPPFAERCDLILLGVGEDGHTASLFPGTAVLRESHRMAQEVFVPHLASWRVTLTLPFINRARAVLFLVAGERKAAVVGRILESKQMSEELPATLVRPYSGTLTWMLDAQAASLVPKDQGR